MCIIEPGFFKTAVTSLDPLERELHRLWNQLSPEVQASYGDKYLDKCKQTAYVYVERKYRIWRSKVTVKTQVHCDFEMSHSGYNKLNSSVKLVGYIKNIFYITLIFRHQGPAFDHECHLWLWPHQGDQLHGARSDCCPPTHQIQRRLGRQAYLDPALLHAFLCSWYRTEAGAAASLKERVAHDDFEEMALKLIGLFVSFWCGTEVGAKKLFCLSKYPYSLSTPAMHWCDAAVLYLYVNNFPCGSIGLL